MRKLTREEMYEYRDKYDFAPLYISSMDTSLSGRDAAKRQDSIHANTFKNFLFKYIEKCHGNYVFHLYEILGELWFIVNK